VRSLNRAVPVPILGRVVATRWGSPRPGSPADAGRPRAGRPAPISPAG